MNACLTGQKNPLWLEHLPAGADDESAVWVRFHHIAAEQAIFRHARLCELHRGWFGPKGVLAVFFAEINGMGRQAPLLNDALALRDSRRRKSAEQALVFVLAKANRRTTTGNPFKGRSRAYLCCVIFDKSTSFTLCERYAAYEAVRERDSQYFAKLIKTTRNVPERRLVFRGLLEYFDQLLPIEKCVYPDGYREVHKAHLDREETVHGPLQLDQPISVLLSGMAPAQLVEQIRHPVQVLRR